MSNIEQRILEMKFNNGQFENALKTSLGSLDRLKQSLNFSGAGKSLTGLSAAAKSVNMESLASGVEAVRVKFGALDVMAMTALTNITNRAMTAGSQLAQSFTIAPIGQGFGEYETKIGSIQTMLANTSKYGTTLGEVKKSLEKLNEYSDKTIYNFGDMTKNIGLFTNAGIRIQDATEMIQGFSNAAAASGTTSQGASGAAYQLSQALSAGTIRLMDWRSLTNVGMGNKNMQSGIIEIAKAMGTLDKAGLSASDVTKDFTGTLEKGWLSADVMSNYLKIMTWDSETMTKAEKKAYDQKLKSLGLSDKQITAFKKEAQMASDAATKVRTLTSLIGTIQESIGSGWATTFELLLGDFNEATTLFTNIKDALDPIITSQADNRNNLIKEWIKLGGRSAIIEGFTNAWKVFAAVATAAKDAFKEVFPPKATNGLKESVAGIRAFVAGIRLSKDQVKAIRGGFVVFFSIIKIGVTILKMGVGAAILLASVIRNVLGAALAIGQKAFNLLGVALSGLMAGFGYSFIGFDALGGYIMKLFDDLSKLNFGAIQPLIDIWNKLSGVIGRFGADAGGALAGVFSFDNFKALGKGILDIWNSLGQVIKSTIDLGGRTQSTFMGWFGNFFKGVADAVKGLKDFVVNGVKMVKDAIVGVSQGVSGGIDGVSGAEVIGAIGSGLSLGVIIVLIKKIKKAFEPITKLFDSVTGVFDSVAGAWDQLTSTLKTMQKDVKANIIVKIAAAILILAIAMKVLSEIDPNRLVSASAGIATSVAALATGMLVMDKMNMDTKGIIKIGLAMILLATAIIILGKAVKIFGNMSWESLAKGLISITVTIGGLLIMVKAMSKNGDDIIKASIGMNLLAFAIITLAGAVAAFGYMPVEVLKQGGLAIGAILLGMMFFMGVVKEDSILKASAAMVLLSIAIAGLVPPILALGMMDPKVLQQGAGSILLLVFALALASRVMENSTSGAAAIVVMALALTILLIPIRQIGEMDLAALNQGLLYLGLALLGLVVAVKMMEGSGKGALAMLAIAVAITILAFAIVTLGSAPIEVVAVGLGVIIGAILAFGIAALVLSGAIPAIAALSAALLVFGVAMLVVSASIIILAIGLTMLGPAAAIGAGGIVVLATAIASVADKIPAVLGLALGFVGLAAAMLLVAAAVVAFGVGLVLVGAGLTMIGLATAAGAVGGLTAVVEAVRGLIWDVPGMLAVGGALAVLGAGMVLVGAGGIVMAVAMVALSVALIVVLGVAAAVVAVFPGVGTAFEQLGAKVPSLAVLAEAMINLGAASSNLSGAMISSAGALTASADQLDRVSSSALQTTVMISNMPAVIISSMSGVASSMGSSANNINATVIAIGVSMILLKTNLDRGGEDANKAIGNMTKNISSGTTGIRLAVLTLMNGLISALNGSRSNVESSAVKIGEAVINGMVRGLSDSGRVRSAARSVALSALDAANKALGIASPSKAFHLVGSRSVDGLEGGFLDSKNGLFRTVGRMAEGLTEEFKLAYYEIGDSVSDLMNTNPVIRPVIDLDDATRGAKALNGMLATSFDIENSRLAVAKVAGSVGYEARASETPTPAQPSQKTVSFVQNNYSPKALSRIDIYRNTKNQLSAATGVTK